MRELLKIDNATIKYRQEVLFEGLDFEIRRGQHWAIVGESGSGKSALLQTLAGKHIISEGRIINYYFEEFIKDNPVDDPYFTYHDLISYVDIKHDFRNLSHTRDFYYQQRYNAWDSDDAPTVEDFLNEKVNGTFKRQKWAVEDVFSKFNLEQLRKKQLIKLSNGESKRLRIAAALLNGPELLLLDNPLTGLDVDSRKKFNSLFDEIASSGITLVMVTSPFEIPDIVTHVVVLSKRKLLYIVDKSDFKPELMNSATPALPDAVQIKKVLSRRDQFSFGVAVEMKNVSVKYGESTILHNINWKVASGERWALSGPNGSGKSTLLSLINGDNPQAYANDITIFDRKRGTGESIWDLKKKIGFMSPELYQYFPLSYNCLKVVESGFYDTIGLFTESKVEDEKVAMEWLELMHLKDFAHTKLSDLSASRQRLCLLARALVKNPYLLILDEPCQGLDLNQQLYFKNMIDKISELSDLSLIYVTHYKEELPSCISRTFTLDFS